MWLLLGILLLVALLIRIWALQGRWINPDEGAHLMSGRLAMEGMVPGLDWSTRQIMYVYIVGGFQELFGYGLTQGRMLATLATLGAGAFLFLGARRLFDGHVALLATAFFLLLPFSIVLTVHAKTQPQAILMATAAVYFLVRALDDEGTGGWALLLCGLSLGVGYYIRQSNLALVPIVVLLVVARHRADPARLLRALTVFTVGFLGVSMAVFAFYLIHVNPAQAWLLSENPAAWVLEQLARLPRLVGMGSPGVEPGMPAAPGGAVGDSASGTFAGNAAGQGFERSAQPLDRAVQNALEAASLNSFLVVGGIASLAYAGALFRLGAGYRWRAVRSYGIPLFWAGLLALAYGYWTLGTSFFQAYFLELMPPLCILTAAVLRDALDGLGARSGLLRDAGILVGVLLVFALAHVVAGTPQLNRPLYFAIGALLLGGAYLATRERARRWLLVAAGIAALSWVVILLAGGLPLLGDLVVYGAFAAILYAAVLWAGGWPGALPGRSAAAFVAYSLVVSAFAHSLFASADELDRSYDAAWSPDTVAAVVAILGREAAPDDEVLSGGVVWEYEAGLRSFRNEAHPLQFLWSMSERSAAAIRGRLEEDPPRFIILDGFMQRTYLRHLPDIEPLIEERYELLGEFGESFFRVRVFGLTREAAGNRSRGTQGGAVPAVALSRSSTALPNFADSPPARGTVRGDADPPAPGRSGASRAPSPCGRRRPAAPGPGRA